eukprot:s69_g28.t1
MGKGCNSGIRSIRSLTAAVRCFLFGSHLMFCDVLALLVWLARLRLWAPQLRPSLNHLRSFAKRGLEAATPDALNVATLHGRVQRTLAALCFECSAWRSI